ncbi:DNA modification methylase [Mesoflavibacter sabulilitoris]|uniref:site-specific DNA-methyltransferase (adenine-specific) n=1 Tax=Mesoflavibacter zeaxanthinifaciens subsp. sabulilitoris TaxID=1520893 RepID=A0A2T1NAG5_9FLAO|nr:DNA modification methylase [Mesoflavibacter zeaxanthinifaciens]MBB3123738.1 DNA modification methylase [Mesoflavibacter zeaxanthinifaciens subsp. sabulilitoris]PSG89141.1 DNA methylase [Mesoflavibacter zeaxanthinifaciens subsp. sabulilitoris]
MDNKELIAPLEWENAKRKVKDLVPFEYNPRKLTPEKKQLLINSIEKFNLAEVPAINLDNKIIAGHQRIKVLMDLGRGDELIDVRIPNRPLTDKEFKEYNITSNVPIGFWDVDVLDAHFEDINLEALGLNLDEINLPADLFQYEVSNEEEQDFEPVLPKDPITKLGDVYEFVSKQKGITHKLVCGDSTNAKTYKTLGDEDFDLVATDPPYNVNYEGGTKEKLKIKNDNMSGDDFYSFLYLFFQEVFVKSKPGAPIYVFHADSEGANFRLALKNAGFKLAQCLVWIKNSLVMGRQDYHWKHEPCLYGWKEGEAHKWYSDRKQTTVLEFDKPLRNEEHPTMKPLDLWCYIIKNSSKQKDIVADPFGGSGTTLISCEKLWRQARIIELGENYVDVHVSRYIKYMNDNKLDFVIKKNDKTLKAEDLNAYLNE